MSTTIGPKPPWNSPKGLNCLRTVLLDLLPPKFDAHDFQLERTAQILDRVDTVLLTATGDGKIALFFLPLLISLCAGSSRHASTVNEFHTPKNLLVVLVLPLNALEHELAKAMEKYDIFPLVINSDTLKEAHDRGENLWESALSPTVHMIMLSPEKLTSREFDALLKNDAFRKRALNLGIDEAHLLNSWGPEFRIAFQEIGNLWSRFPKDTTCVATTATLAPGRAFASVCQSLGLHRGKFTASSTLLGCCYCLQQCVYDRQILS
jgi:superfamily II DNA helicase RecQ